MYAADPGAGWSNTDAGPSAPAPGGVTISWLRDLMVSVLRGNSANRDALREFITDLAARKEQEFTVISQDAQACRTQLSKIPTAAPRRSTK